MSGDAALRLSILLFCYEYPPLGGGGGVGAQTYAEAWARKGHRVRVLTGGGPGLPRREDVGGVEVVRVRHLARAERATASGLSMLAYLVFGGLHVLRHRREFQGFDVINTHFSLPTGPLGWFASKCASLPNVLTIIGGDIYDPSRASSPHRHAHWRWANRFLIEAADQVVAISSDTRRRAQEHYGIRRPILISNYGFRPMEEVQETRFARDDDLFQLVAIGRLVERKGFHYLLEALTHLPDQVRLWIIGDGPLEAELEKWARRHGIRHRVSLLGYLSSREILARLRAADCFVLPSLHEGLGIVVQEAMYAGLPVVATNNGGQVDLIRPDRNGLLVPVADTRALSEAITHIQKNPDLARSMGEHNKSDIKGFFVDEKCEEYLDIFRTFVNAESSLKGR